MQSVPKRLPAFDADGRQTPCKEDNFYAIAGKDEFLREFLCNILQLNSFIFLRVHPPYIKFFSTNGCLCSSKHWTRQFLLRNYFLDYTLYPCLQSDNPLCTCEGRFFIDGSIFIYCALQTVPIRGFECRR